MWQRFGYVAAAVVVGWTCCVHAQVKVGDKPAVEFKAVSGEQVSLQGLHGKLVVVDFWATWCGPCMAEADHMVKINQDYHDKGLQIIGISLDHDTGTMQQVAKSKGFDWPQCCDGQAWQTKFAVAFGVHGIPHTFLFGPDGTVLWDGHPAQIDEPLAKAFKEHPPQLVDPKILADANGILDQVDAAIKAQTPAEATKLWAKLPADAMKDGAYATRATALQKQLEDYGNSVLSEIDAQIASRQYSTAVGELKELVLAMKGLPCGVEAAKRLSALMANPDAKAQFLAQDKSHAADDMLATAQKLKDQHKDELAYPKFKAIVKDFAGTPAADKANNVVKVYEQDPALLVRINETAGADKAKSLLNLARGYKTADKPELAAKKYQEVIDRFPGTSFAETARQELAAAGK